MGCDIHMCLEYQEPKFVHNDQIKRHEHWRNVDLYYRNPYYGRFDDE